MALKISRAAGALAVVLAGLAAMGADPAPGAAPAAPATKAEQAAAASAAILKVLPSPRLFQITTTRSYPAHVDETQMCLGPDLMQKLVGAAIEHPKETAEFATALSKGCTNSRETKAEGAMRMEMRCDKAAGAFATSRMVIEGTLKDMHQHMDMELDLGASAPKTVSTDAHFVDAGPCPADMKSGQMRTADGKVVDPLGLVAAAGTPAAAKAAPLRK
jgi:hypothetical protein